MPPPCPSDQMHISKSIGKELRIMQSSGRGKSVQVERDRYHVMVSKSDILVCMSISFCLQGNFIAIYDSVQITRTIFSHSFSQLHFSNDYQINHFTKSEIGAWCHIRTLMLAASLSTICCLFVCLFISPLYFRFFHQWNSC